MAFDPIELEVLWQSLIATVNEQARALQRAAFSPIVREAGERFGVTRLIVEHRLGTLGLGDVSVAVTRGCAGWLMSSTVTPGDGPAAALNTPSGLASDVS